MKNSTVGISKDMVDVKLQASFAKCDINHFWILQRDGNSFNTYFPNRIIDYVPWS